jgi:hypothetical protein
MKKTILFVSILLALTASVALAGGVSIAWGTLCYTEGGPSSSATTFACNTNSGNRVMTTSFKLDNAMDDMIALEWAIDGQSDDAAIPDWWKLGVAPDCRAGKATYNSNYTSVETATCVDWTAGAGFNAPNYLWDTNKAHLTLGVAIDGGTPYAAAAGQEYYAGGATILFSKVVGTDLCAGCSGGVIFGLKSMGIVALSGRRDDFFEPMPGGNQCLSWNNPTTNCTAVPARTTTWGQIKSLYR